jgi:transcriptional regulator with XRE-family HTH domain
LAAVDQQPQPEPGDPFVVELKRWRDVRGMSQSALAKKVGYTPSYVSKVEGGQQHASLAKPTRCCALAVPSDEPTGRPNTNFAAAALPRRRRSR